MCAIPAVIELLVICVLTTSNN